MGTRHLLILPCAHCGVLNDEVWYAPTSNADTFICVKCAKTSFIVTVKSDFKTKKLSEVTLKDVEQGFLSATSQAWSKEDLKRICEQRFNELKGRSR